MNKDKMKAIVITEQDSLSSSQPLNEKDQKQLALAPLVAAEARRLLLTRSTTSCSVLLFVRLWWFMVQHSTRSGSTCLFGSKKYARPAARCGSESSGPHRWAHCIIIFIVILSPQRQKRCNRKQRKHPSTLCNITPSGGHVWNRKGISATMHAHAVQMAAFSRCMITWWMIHRGDLYLL
jgi:hypothetical protein